MTNRPPDGNGPRTYDSYNIQRLDDVRERLAAVESKIESLASKGEVGEIPGKVYRTLLFTMLPAFAAMMAAIIGILEYLN